MSKAAEKHDLNRPALTSCEDYRGRLPGEGPDGSAESACLGHHSDHFAHPDFLAGRAKTVCIADIVRMTRVTEK